MKRFFIFALFCILGVMVWFVLQFRAPSRDESIQTFEIASGESVNVVSAHLKSGGFIRNSFVFESLMWLMKEERTVKAGVYRMPKNLSVFEIIDRLVRGTTDADNRLTLIEGWTLKAYAAYLAGKGYDMNAFVSATESAAAWADEFGFLRDAPQGATLEGYLFPDTYSADPQRSATQLVRVMLRTFERKVLRPLQDSLSSSAMTLHEVVTLASIVEKEVSGSENRRMVADIFLKRLDAGIGLQSDATVNYITGSGRTQSTAEDLSIDSPYNTYKYKGLPPGPIGNPGAEAINAVLGPLNNDYYYFLTGNDGAVHYARTFEEHQDNKQKYLR